MNRRTPKAFSITELLVVVLIMSIVMVIAVPSFKSLTYSMRRSSAQNALKGGMRAARMVAIDAGEGRDAAAVFMHEPGGRVTIIPCVFVGEMLDQGGGNQLERVEIFAPVAGVDAVQMPAGWSVRAFAPPNSMGASGKQGTGWYDSGNYPITQGNWIFPETGFYDVTLPREGNKRQTFMVRYRGGSGEVDLSNIDPVLIVNPSPSAAFRTTGIYKEHRVDTAIDLERFVNRVLGDNISFQGRSGLTERFDLLGNRSSDTVLARSVGQLAVYNERRLAGGVGAQRVNRDTQTLYEGGDEPKLDLEIFPSGATNQSVSDSVSDWLESRMASSDALIFTIQRYSGRAQEMVSLNPGSGG